MEIKKTNLKVTDRMELNPIDVNSINEPKKIKIKKLLKI